MNGAPSQLETASAANAQSSVNFAVLLPRELPGDCRADLDGGSLRREGPPADAAAGNWHRAGTSSFVFRIRGAARALRVKEFLYDLGPLSALDHAALYDHDAWRLTALDMGDGRLCWLGTDYEAKRAACFLGWGTNAELRVEEGAFSDEELLSIARSMSPPAAAKALENKPFAELTYWSRHPRYDLNMCASDYRPPSSLWKLRWPWAQAEHSWSTDLPSFALPAGKSGVGAISDEWRFDSACRFGAAENPVESQALFFPAAGPRHRLFWLREFPEALCPLAKPRETRLPEMDRFSGLAAFGLTVASAAGAPPVRVFVASVSKDFGPHDAVWWEGGRMFLAQASSRANGGVDDFLRTVSRLLGRRLRVENGNVL